MRGLSARRVNCNSSSSTIMDAPGFVRRGGETWESPTPSPNQTRVSWLLHGVKRHA
jgi:hypothetical protein